MNIFMNITKRLLKLKQPKNLYLFCPFSYNMCIKSEQFSLARNYYIFDIQTYYGFGTGIVFY